VAQLAHDEDADHVRGHVIATLTAALGRRKSGDTAAPAAPVLRAAVAEEIR
jgi:hypothetical protein